MSQHGVHGFHLILLLLFFFLRLEGDDAYAWLGVCDEPDIYGRGSGLVLGQPIV